MFIYCWIVSAICIIAATVFFALDIASAAHDLIVQGSWEEYRIKSWFITIGAGLISLFNGFLAAILVVIILRIICYMFTKDLQTWADNNYIITDSTVEKYYEEDLAFGSWCKMMNRKSLAKERAKVRTVYGMVDATNSIPNNKNTQKCPAKPSKIVEDVKPGKMSRSDIYRAFQEGKLTEEEAAEQWSQMGYGDSCAE